LQDERLTQADYHRLKECLTISQLVDKTAQQSVHLTDGIRRIFQALFLALANVKGLKGICSTTIDNIGSQKAIKMWILRLS